MPRVAGILLALPALIFPYLPSTDFAPHESIVALLRNMGDASLYPPGLYVHNFGHPNQLFYLVAWPLSYVLGVHLACKLVFAAGIFLVLEATAALCRHLDVSPWAALLAAPIALGSTFYGGLVANLLGIAVLIAWLPAIDRFAARPSVAGALLMCAWALLQYFAHEALLFLGLGALFLFFLARARGLRAWVLLAPPLVFSVALVLVQAVLQEPLKSGLNRHLPTLFSPLDKKLSWGVFVLFGPDAQGFEHAAFVALYALLLVLLVPRRVGQRAKVARSLRGWLEALRFEAFGLAGVFLYLVMPYSLNGATYVFQRSLPPAAIVLYLTAAPRGTELRVPVKFLLAMLPALAIAASIPEFVEATQVNEDLDALVNEIEPGSAVANLELHSDTEGVFFGTFQASTRVLSERGGRMLFSFTESPISPVISSLDRRWEDSVSRYSRGASLLRPSFDLRRYRYVLACTRDGRTRAAVPRLLSPEAELVDTRGVWMLFRSRIWDTPIAAPDALPPDDTETMEDRFRRGG